MNAPFMVLGREIFTYMKDGEKLVEKPSRQFIDAGRLMVYPPKGYWACMDTLKEKRDLEDLFVRSRVPWAVWSHQHEIYK